MNIIDILNLRIKKILIDFFKNQNLNTTNNFSNFSVELPKNEKNADISSNVAMIYSKFACMKSLELAEILRIELLKICVDYDFSQTFLFLLARTGFCLKCNTVA